MSSYSHLQRAPRSKEEFRAMIAQWDRLEENASEAKRRANVNGTNAEVQPYLDRMFEISSARTNWLNSYDDTFHNLPER